MSETRETKQINTDELKITVVINANNGVPCEKTVLSLREARGVDDVDIAILADKEPREEYVKKIITAHQPESSETVWILCKFIKSLDELYATSDGDDKMSHDIGHKSSNKLNRAVFEIMSGDTVDESILEHIKEFYDNHDLTESMPDDIRQKFITKGVLTAANFNDGYKYTVSCIVPFHNAKKRLYGVIESVLLQNYDWDAETQLILVDDGSDDGSAEIAREYANDFPGGVVLVTQDYKGVNAAYNAGLDVAEGRYAAFWDAKKEMPENYLNSAIEAFEAEKSIDFVTLPFDFAVNVYGIDKMRDPGFKFVKRVFIDNNKADNAKSFGKCKVKISADRMVVRKEALDGAKLGKVRFDELVGVGGDGNADDRFVDALLANNPLYGVSDVTMLHG